MQDAKKKHLGNSNYLDLNPEIILLQFIHLEKTHGLLKFPDGLKIVFFATLWDTIKS